MGTAVMQPTGRGTGPYVPGKLNTQMTPLWHRRAFAASAVLGSEITFFDQAGGTGGVGPEFTNMTRSFELESPRQITVGAMGINFYDTATADIWKIVKNYTVQLSVGGNVLLNAPPDVWLAGHGISGTGVQNGVPDMRALNLLSPHPIYIPSGTGFAVRFVGAPQTLPPAAAMIGVFLYGPLSKPVS